MLKNNSGFTLIELILVTAISGLLLVIVFAGQRQLQDQARFNESVDTAIQDVSYARNYATAHVNEVGSGTSTNSVTAGSGIEFDDAHIGLNFPLIEVVSLYADQDSGGNMILSTLDDEWPPQSGPVSGCLSSLHPEDPRLCIEDFMHIPDTDIQVTNFNHVMIYFVNTPEGLRICHDSGTVWQTVAAACSTFGGPPIPIVLRDSEGFSATIDVDATTGVATRN